MNGSGREIQVYLLTVRVKLSGSCTFILFFSIQKYLKKNLYFFPKYCLIEKMSLFYYIISKNWQPCSVGLYRSSGNIRYPKLKWPKPDNPISDYHQIFKIGYQSTFGYQISEIEIGYRISEIEIWYRISEIELKTGYPKFKVLIGRFRLYKGRVEEVKDRVGVLRGRVRLYKGRVRELKSSRWRF